MIEGRPDDAAVAWAEAALVRDALRTYGVQVFNAWRTQPQTPDRELVGNLIVAVEEASCLIDRLTAERDEARRERDALLDDLAELEAERDEVVKSFESELWNAVRRLVNEYVGVDWRDYEDGMSADDAYEALSATLKDGRTRGDRLTAERDEARRERDRVAAEWAEVSQGNYQRAKAAEAERDALKAENERLRAAWRPIETAPKDGTPVVVAAVNRWKPYKRKGGLPGRWQEPTAYGWRNADIDPAFWMPFDSLPTPPTGEKGDE